MRRQANPRWPSVLAAYLLLAGLGVAGVRAQSELSTVATGTNAACPTPAPTPPCTLTPVARPACTGKFADVASEHWACSWIEMATSDTRKLMSACGATGSTGAAYFCPEEFVTREDMAVHLERGLRGGTYQPPSGASTFVDVRTTYALSPWIGKLVRDGVATGCDPVGPKYCPYQPVSRAEMAVFLARALMVRCYNLPEGCTPDSYVPTSGYAGGSFPGGGYYNCTAAGGTSLFTDVPPNHWACKQIHYILAMKVTTGCGLPGKFCPLDSVTRAQMAAFLKRAFVGYDPS